MSRIITNNEICRYIPPALREISLRAGVPLYLVGGFTRGFLMDKPNAGDVDVCGPLSSAEMQNKTGLKFTVVLDALDTSVFTADGKKYEYTPFRIERYAAGGAHTPEAAAFTPDIYQDSLRRDFTCNAVYCSAADGAVTDFHGGVEDIGRGILRRIGAETFKSDGLRLLRLCRFAAETGFEIDPQTMSDAVSNAANLKDITKPRIREELDRILAADAKYGVEGAHYRGLSLIGETGLWKYVLPGVDDMAGCRQNPVYHKYDVYEHTLRTVLHAPPAVRLAALVHDIGKPYCERTDGNTYRHHTMGAELARQALGQEGLMYSNAVVTKVARLVSGHMFNLRGDTSENKIRLFVSENHDIVEDLEALVLADGLACGLDYVPKEKFLPVLKRMREQGAPVVPKELAINGSDVLRAAKSIGVAIEGQEVGALLRGVFLDCLYGNAANDRKTLLTRLEKYFKKLKK
ncbi:MAG: HD domain-containing protein [Firmicutes bacterium]|nr:HD domain-containing protein [Bacillota bacterium]